MRLDSTLYTQVLLVFVYFLLYAFSNRIPASLQLFSSTVASKIVAILGFLWEDMNSVSFYSTITATSTSLSVLMPVSHASDYHNFIVCFRMKTCDHFGYLESLDISHEF